MDIKLVSGIFLPLILILLLIILSSSNIGFSLEKQYVNSVQFSSLFMDKNSLKNPVLIETINITNDFFLPRRYEIPKMIVCLNDRDEVKETQNFIIEYKEGSYTKDSNTPIFNKIIHDNRNYYEETAYLRPSIELPVNSKKQIQVLIRPISPYKSNIDSYREYDELIVIEPKDTDRYYGYYDLCTNLNSEEINSINRIPISQYR